MSLKSVCEGLPDWAHYLVFICLFMWEYWLGKTSKLKASSTIGLIVGLIKPKEKKMELAKGVVGEFKEGKIVISVEVASMVAPILADLKAKIESGAIDPVKGTDMDKEALLKAIDFLSVQVSK